MKVVISSSGLTYHADAPFSTRLRANAMAAQGLKVAVVGYPESYPSDLGPCFFDYISVTGSFEPDKKARWQAWKKQLGPYWTHAIEPFLVKLAAFRYGRETGADVLYVANVEPWIFLILAWFNHHSRRRIPTATMIPYMFQKAAGDSLSAKIRGWLNHKAVNWLPRYSEIICDNIHVARVFKMDQQPTVHIIPEGLRENAGPQPQAEVRKALGIPAGKRMLLLFGVAGKGKGAEFLFNAMDGLEPKCMVYVVGKTGGVYEDSWGAIDHLREKGWENNLRVISRFVSENEMAQFFSACDGVVLPYRHGYATTSGNLTMAIEYGKAVIASDQFYLGDVVGNNHLGLLFPPENVKALRCCLAEFSEKPDSWFEEIRRNARRVMQEKSWANVGIMYRRLFEQMTAAEKKSN